MDDDVRFSLRIPGTLLEKLRRVAAQEERSINSIIVRALRAYVQRKDGEQDAAASPCTSQGSPPSPSR